ncbi:response regulator transcription factor [Hahella ganghwensis]|uniref:response regulator transcription factor n=1 Tax=Hahella ganghwensis TaxID=286420 RepID=UPI0003789550|nr:response regulator transcription factor [Hahella ganghwensis]
MGTPYEIGLCGEIPGTIQTACSATLHITACDREQIAAMIAEGQQLDVILLCQPLSDAEQIALLQEINQLELEEKPPCLVILESPDANIMMSFIDAGADDVLDSETGSEELITRIHKAVLNRIASRQLKSQLKLANEVAMSAMTDTSDLGNNIQFLVEVSKCDNFDQLGIQLFQALDYYDLNCSLQIRGRFNTKNMERSGIARELETQLLTHFSKAARFHQSGKRLFCNYGSISLLIKNMPIGDEIRCGKIRDNIFALLQGADAKVTALDDATEVELRMQLLNDLSRRMLTALTNLETSYLSITNEIVTATEHTNEQITSSLHYLGLSESQEQAICDIMSQLITSTNQTFNRGVQINQQHRKYFEQIEAAITPSEDEQTDSVTQLQTLLAAT